MLNSYFVCFIIYIFFFNFEIFFVDIIFVPKIWVRFSFYPVSLIFEYEAKPHIRWPHIREYEAGESGANFTSVIKTGDGAESSIKKLHTDPVSHPVTSKWNTNMHKQRDNRPIWNKSHDAFDKCPTIHHFVTKMCTHMHMSVTKWCIVRYGTGALWDLWIWSTQWGMSPLSVLLSRYPVQCSQVTETHFKNKTIDETYKCPTCEFKWVKGLGIKYGTG